MQEKQEPKAQQEAKGQQPAQQKRPAGQQPKAQQSARREQAGAQPAKNKAVKPAKLPRQAPNSRASSPMPKRRPAPKEAKVQQPAPAPEITTVERPAGRVINTRTVNVNIDRYNEKYDRLASEKVRTDNTVQKQKLPNAPSSAAGRRIPAKKPRPSACAASRWSAKPSPLRLPCPMRLW